MEIGMGQSLDLLAVGALAARIAVETVAAAEILHVSDGQRQSPGSGAAGKELGMADAAGIDRLRQMPLQLLLSYDVSETHDCLLFSECRPQQRPERPIRSRRTT